MTVKGWIRQGKRKAGGLKRAGKHGVEGEARLCGGRESVGGWRGRDTGSEALTIAQEASLNPLVVLVPKGCQG